jgi:hypothetical protein
MTAVLVYRLYCDGGPCPATFEDPLAASFNAARRSAKFRGWSRQKRDDSYVDLCPTCSAAGGAA